MISERVVYRIYATSCILRGRGLNGISRKPFFCSSSHHQSSIKYGVRQKCDQSAMDILFCKNDFFGFRGFQNLTSKFFTMTLLFRKYIIHGEKVKSEKWFSPFSTVLQYYNWGLSGPTLTELCHVIKSENWCSNSGPEAFVKLHTANYSKCTDIERKNNIWTIQFKLPKIKIAPALRNNN